MQKKKSGVKKCLEICAIKGGGRGGRRLMANTILNFHFDYWNTSLTKIVASMKFPSVLQRLQSLHSDGFDSLCLLRMCALRGEDCVNF